ncbi:sugar transferase [Salinicoccus roseus]|uniref:sugar transferase n=1 Tax=Salinicoccus roseus TaxID=45670 RepID=UPI0023015B75|nr:sugar transferase [Salinicoccus roseus]
MIDIIVSMIGIILLSPLFLLVIFLIKITMPGPILFKQKRAGKGNIIFDIYKFRSMKIDLKAEKNFDFDKDKNRVTKFGKLLRRYKIDETPQLFNVFKGDMSLVGPRPTIEKQTKNYTHEQRKRLLMRPGMTGLAQVNGNISNSWEKRIEYDLQYIRNFNILLDSKIILKTFLIVLFGEEKFRK